MGRAVAVNEGLRGCHAHLAERYLGEHLPTTDSDSAVYLRTSAEVERRLCFSSPCTSSKHRSWRHAWAGQEYGGEAVKDRAGRGGAHGRARVRTRAHPRAWQRVRRRHAAPLPSVALEIGGGTLRELINRRAVLRGGVILILPRLAKPRLVPF